MIIVHIFVEPAHTFHVNERDPLCGTFSLAVSSLVVRWHRIQLYCAASRVLIFNAQFFFPSFRSHHVHRELGTARLPQATRYTMRISVPRYIPARLHLVHIWLGRLNVQQYTEDLWWTVQRLSALLITFDVRTPSAYMQVGCRFQSS